MLCPKCNVEMTIRTALRVTGDTSADEATRVFLVQRFFCRNKACAGYGAEQARVEHEMETGVPETVPAEEPGA